MSTLSARKLIPLIAIFIASTTLVAAQSGRRGKAKSTAPPAPAPAPTESESKPQAAKTLNLLVGIDNPSSFERVRYDIPDLVLYTCMQRLDDAKEVKPTPAPRRMTRHVAVEAAKAETSRPVIWLQVLNEKAGFGADVSTHSDQLYVSYVIFEPITGKIKASGRTQFRSAKVGDVGVSGRTSTRRSIGDTDYAIKESARQAAEKILAAFGIRLSGWPLARK